MVKPYVHEGREIYLCEVCGYGYEERAVAERCEAFCTEHNACSLEITKDAVYRPEA
jgi:hypothetical protein